MRHAAVAGASKGAQILRRLAQAGLSLLAFGASAVPAYASGWSKGYVVDYYFFPGWADGAEDSNCPQGSTPMPNWKKALDTGWRTPEELDKLTGPGQIGYGSPLGNRGPKPGMNVYADPTLIPEPDSKMEVVGNTGYGFDLDGDASTGFVTPDGNQRGLDNNIYRALGCHHWWRGGGRDAPEPRVTEVYDTNEMRGGTYTVVVHLSGEGADPRNDDSVRVGIYLSRDPIVKDAQGEVANLYSYRIDPDPRFMSVFDAKSVDGVVTPREPLDVLRVREYQSRPKFAPDLILEKPQIDLTMLEGDKLHVRMGGYREWRYVYESFGAGGVSNEISGAMQVPNVWYTLKRHADWKPPGTTGPNTHISAYYTMDAVPAYLVSPDKAVVVRAEWFDGDPIAASESPRSMAGRIRSIAGNSSFRLEGGAASWPEPPSGELPPRDSLGWAKRLVDPRGGIATRGMQLPDQQSAEAPSDARTTLSRLSAAGAAPGR